MGAAWYAEDSIEEPITIFNFAEIPGHGLIGSLHASQDMILQQSQVINTGLHESVLMRQTMQPQLVVTPPPSGMLSSVILNGQTPAVMTNSVMNNSRMRRSILHAPLPIAQPTLFETTVAPVLDTIADTFVPANIAQPSIINTGAYSAMQLPGTIPLYDSVLGGGQDVPPSNIAVPTNPPVFSQSIQRRMAQLGVFQVQGMETGMNLGQAYLFVNLGIVYIGQWIRGKPHGRGRMIFPNGSIYDGYFYRGKTIGRGRFFQINGDYYQGDFMGLAAHGQGVCVVGNLIYEGQFMQNVPHGTGLQSTLDGSVKFFGQYNHGAKVFGKMQWNGFVYKGPFVNGLFNGLALVRTPQGVFQGNFVDGRMISGSPVQNMLPAGGPIGGIASTMNYAGVNPYSSNIGIGGNQLLTGSIVATPGWNGASTLQGFAGPNYLNNYRLSAF